MLSASDLAYFDTSTSFVRRFGRKQESGSWSAGYLHRECLEHRIGRSLTDADLLVKAAGETFTRGRNDMP